MAATEKVTQKVKKCTGKPAPLVKGIPNLPCHHEKAFRIGLTGMVRLSSAAGRGFKSRHQLESGYVERADGMIYTKRDAAVLEDGGENVTRKLRRIKERCTEEPEEKKKRRYRLNKTKVKRYIRSMANLVQYCKGKGTGFKQKKAAMYFWTVTFLEGTSDQMCRQLLNTWLTNLRQNNLLYSYLWVAERQKNGTLHFHLIVPHYLNVQRANTFMRQSIIFQIKRGALPHWSLAVAKKYNGVDIKKDKRKKGRQKATNFAAEGKWKALAFYLTKYVSKNNEESDDILWHCSRDWGTCCGGINMTLREVVDSLGESRRWLEPGSLKSEFFSFWRWRDFRPPDKVRFVLAQIMLFLLTHVTGGNADNIFNF